MGKTIGRPNVLVIIEDALRADRLHCYGNPFPTSPAMDRLAREGVQFETAIAHSANTMPCVVSAFTGLDILFHGLVDPRTHARHSWHGWKTPFEILEENGYAIAGQDDWVYYHLGDHRLPRNVDEVKVFIEENRDRSFFIWRMPDYTHLPYNPDPPLDTLFLPRDYSMSEATRERLKIVRQKMIIHRPGLISKFELEQAKGVQGDTYSGGLERDSEYQRSAGTLELKPEDKPGVTALYDGRVRMLDDEVDQYIAKLEELGLLDNTIVVLTGDHGEELLERGAIGHTSCSLEGSLYEEAIRVPLLIRYPRGLPKGATVTTQVSQYDIMPTLFDLVGLQMPRESEGRSLVSLARGEQEGFVQETYAMTPPCGWQLRDDDDRKIWCLRTPEWKLHHYDFAPKAANRYELFNLRQDPGEKHNLYEQQSRVAAELERKLNQWMNRGPSPFMRD